MATAPRKATCEDLRQCLPWFRPTRFGREARLGRLNLFQDKARRGLAVLLKGASADLRQLADRVDQAAEKLLARTVSGNRPSRKSADPPSPVSCFEEYDDGWRCLLHQLGNHRPLSHCEADALADVRNAFIPFGDEFPILMKLAACRRLVRQLRESRPNAAALVALAAFLDEGTQWLSSFTERDRQRVAQLTPGRRKPPSLLSRGPRPHALALRAPPLAPLHGQLGAARRTAVRPGVGLAIPACRSLDGR